MNLANVRPGSKKLRGTGGTALIPFLKQARDETGEPAIDAWARRLLSNGPAEPSFAALSKLGEHPDGHLEVVGLSGTWTADDSEGGICHW
jgi:indoleamine 2,3-dioxygenase